MKDYIRMWADQLVHRPAKGFTERMELIGERKAHLGPQNQYAWVSLILEPNDVFEVVDEVDDDDLARIGYPDWFIFGLLDFLMISESTPLIKVRIVLKDAKLDPVDSSPMAFLEAGRDAGRKALRLIET